MKKLVMLIAVALMAAVGQAAAVTWSATKVMNPKDSATALPGAVAYLFDSATLSSSDLVSALKGDGFSTVSSKALSTATSGATGGISKVGETLPSSYVGGNSVSLYAVIFDSSDTTKGNYIITSEKTIVLKSTGATTAAFGSQAGATWTKYGSDVPGSDVPEPTSGLLLLIGGAMLALRRKQK